MDDNERTLIFAAFTAEESGGYGSKYFSKQLNPDDVMAMFNIEMIGKDSKFGDNSAFITGYERSDFGKILQKNLAGMAFKFYPDPYPTKTCFTAAITPRWPHWVFRHIPFLPTRLIRISFIIPLMMNLKHWM